MLESRQFLLNKIMRTTGYYIYQNPRQAIISSYIYIIALDRFISPEKETRSFMSLQL